MTPDPFLTYAVQHLAKEFVTSQSSVTANTASASASHNLLSAIGLVGSVAASYLITRGVHHLKCLRSPLHAKSGGIDFAASRDTDTDIATDTISKGVSLFSGKLLSNDMGPHEKRSAETIISPRIQSPAHIINVPTSPSDMDVAPISLQEQIEAKRLILQTILTALSSNEANASESEIANQCLATLKRLGISALPSLLQDLVYNTALALNHSDGLANKENTNFETGQVSHDLLNDIIEADPTLNQLSRNKDYFAPTTPQIGDIITSGTETEYHAVSRKPRFSTHIPSRHSA